MSVTFAAVGLGTDGGRVLVARLHDGLFSLREVHRFANRPVRVETTIRWDIHRLYGEVLAGLGAAARAMPELASMGIHGWGRDFGLLDARGNLLGAPFHHRDPRTDGIPARLHARVPEADLWAATGVQPVPGNTLYQLHAMALRRSSTLSRAARLLLVPDLLAWWLCGVQAAEHTLASTTQCYDVERRAWVAPLLVRARIPTHIFPPVVPPATLLGPVLPGPARRAGIRPLDVVAPACHETAAAVSVLPAGPGAAFVHVGAGARVGAVLAAPLRSEAARGLGFSNEGGVDGAVVLHRRTAGLRAWHQCRRAWAAGGRALDEESLAALAATGTPFLAAIDLDAPSLLEAEDLPAAVQTWCARTGQAVPEPRADVLRTIVESLAWRYRRGVRDLEEVLGRRVELVHVLGEGAQNALLCQLTADACGRPVRAGPAEAAALGNVLAQAVAARACASWGEARALVRGAFPPVEYEPREPARWDEAAARAEKVLAGSDSP